MWEFHILGIIKLQNLNTATKTMGVIILSIQGNFYFSSIGFFYSLNQLHILKWKHMFQFTPKIYTTINTTLPSIQFLWYNNIKI